MRTWMKYFQEIFGVWWMILIPISCRETHGNLKLISRIILLSYQVWIKGFRHCGVWSNCNINEDSIDVWLNVTFSSNTLVQCLKTYTILEFCEKLILSKKTQVLLIFLLICWFLIIIKFFYTQKNDRTNRAFYACRGTRNQ